MAREKECTAWVIEYVRQTREMMVVPNKDDVSDDAAVCVLMKMKGKLALILSELNKPKCELGRLRSMVELGGPDGTTLETRAAVDCTIDTHSAATYDDGLVQTLLRHLTAVAADEE
jgi:hypothetical protein